MIGSKLLPAIIEGEHSKDKPQTTEEILATNKKAKFIENIEKVLRGDLEEIEIESLGHVEIIKSRILKELDEIVIGQESAKKVFLDILGSALFTNTPNKKGVLGSALFLGPTGVGKTQLAEALAQVLLGSEDRIEIIQGETYKEAHEYARLIGSPPGYIGHGGAEPILSDTNLFSHYKDASKKHELHNLLRYKENFAIVIVDEFEKMHPTIRQMFLGILSKGEIKLPSGKEDDKNIKYSKITNLRNTIFIFTSNIGSKEASRMPVGFNQGKHDKSDEQKRKEQTFFESLKRELSPEFLGRINRNIVVFSDLTDENVYGIIHKHEKRLEQFLIDEGFSNFSIEFSEALKRHLKENGYKKESGARELLSMIDYEILSLLKVHIYEGIYNDIDCLGKLYIDYKDGKISVFFRKVDLGDLDPKIDDVFYSVRKGVFDVVKGGEVRIPLHNGSFLFTHEMITRLVYSYVQLNKLREKGGDRYEEEFEYMRSALFSFGFSLTDIKMIERKSIQNILDENFSFIETYEGFKFADEKEKSVFAPRSWTVVKKIVERKFDELIDMNLDLSLDDIICKI